MDPEVIRDLQTQLNELNTVLSSYSKTMSSMASSLNNTKQSLNENTNEQNKNTTTISKGSEATANLKRSQDESNKILKEVSDNFGRALTSSKNAVVQFSNALLSSEEGMAKYGKAADSLGQSALDIGKNFGVLGTVLGGAAALFGKAAGEIFKLNDNIIQFRDGFAKASGILPVTAGELGNLAKQARFSLDDMQKLAKTTNSLGSSLLGLGGYAGQGAVKFMQIAAVSDKTRRQYGLMGISQEELLDSQAKYVQLQGVSGQAQANQGKTTKRLQQESLAYADNLARMSALTGQSKDQLQAEREQVMLEYEEQVKTMEENKRIKDLRANRQYAEADALEKQQKDRKQAIIAYTDLLGKEQGNLVGRVLRQQGYDETTAVIKNRGDDILALGQKMRDTNGDVTDVIVNSLEKSRRNIQGAAEKFNTSTQVAGEELGKQLIGNQEALVRINKFTDDTVPDALAKIKAATAAKTEPGADPLAESYENWRSIEREGKAKVQTFLEDIDPIRNGLDMLKNAAYAAAAIVSVALLGKAATSLMGGGSGAGAAAGAAGVAAGGAGAASAAAGGYVPGSIRKADLLDKRGRVLQGAALDARMKKLTGGTTKLDKDDGTFGGIIDALKRAGRSSVEVIKGAGVLAIATVELAAGLTVATTLIGAGIIKFVKGLNALDKVDGKNLIQVGLGMAGLGTGVLAMAGGTVAQAFGNINRLFTGGKDPLVQAAEMLTKLASMNLDRKKIEDNGMAMFAFAKAMAAISVLGAAGSIADAVKNMAQTVTSFFGQGELPYQDIEEFSKKDFNHKRIKANAESFTLFANAMAAYQGLGSPTNEIATALAETTSKFFKVKPPLEQAVYFSNLVINPKRTKINADAFILFSEAMASYTGGQGLLSAVSTIAAAKLNSLFGQDSAIDAFYNFSKKDFGLKATENSKAFFQFATAMGILSGTTSSNIISGLGGAAVGAITGAVSAVGNFLGITGPGGKVVEAGKGYTTIEYGSGRVEKRIGSRNWRNNNPGNIEYGSFSKKYNAIGTDGRFAVFPTYQDGRKAKEALLFEGRNYKDLTIAQAITRYAPPSENNTTSYINTVSNATGASANTPLQALSSSQRNSMLNAMEKIEGFKQGKIEVLKAKKGGLFSGPMSGYPMELHGTEMVIPQMSPNSLLMKLAKTNEAVANLGTIIESIEAQLDADVLPGSPASQKTTTTTFLNPQMIAALANKFDSVIDILGESDDVQDKLLRHSMV